MNSSQVFVRGGPSGPGNQWHPDGPRALPYGVFTSRPVQVKIAYWLTDVPSAGMANLVVRPGSQNDQYFDGYDTWDSAQDELVLCPRAGDMLVMNGGVWHRVEAPTARRRHAMNNGPGGQPRNVSIVQRDRLAP